MRRIFVTLVALAATAGLVYAGLRLPASRETPPAASPDLVRVWIQKQEPSVWAWVRRQAKRYEKETGTRVYLRAAADNAKTDLENELLPDLLISKNGDTVLAMLGYGLFIRDDAAVSSTPFPTSLLFSPPSPTPGPSPTPAPTPDITHLSIILIPDGIQLSLSRCVKTADPLRALMDGKGDAAVLTADQARQLPFRVSACPLAKGEGFIPIYGESATAEGDRFMSFLLSEACQRDLTDSGLYSPVLKLYQGNDPVRAMIENSL